jgi:hypothetical protein
VSGDEAAAWLRQVIEGDKVLAGQVLKRWPANMRWLERAADCEAKLAILETCTQTVMAMDDPIDLMGTVLTHLASAYRDREGYAEHWGST